MQDGIDSLQSARESSAAGAARGKGGYSLSQKRVSPFKSPERKVYISSEQLEELQCLPIATPRLDLLYDLGYFYYPLPLC